MPALQANIPALEEELDYDDRTANDEPRYVQWIQGEIADANERRIFDFDYDLVTGDAILANNAPFVDGHLRTVVRVSGDMRFKDFLREYYGLRCFRMHIAFIDVPKEAGEPKLLNQTFRELHGRHQLMQVDILPGH